MCQNDRALFIKLDNDSWLTTPCFDGQTRKAIKLVQLHSALKCLAEIPRLLNPDCRSVGSVSRLSEYTS